MEAGRTPSAIAAEACPRCGEIARDVQQITLKALLRPDVLERLRAPEHRFCASATCPVVYFGADEVFGKEDVLAPVFQKEPAGDRIVCNCLAVNEDDIVRESQTSGKAPSLERITSLVEAKRCACEVRNPQGSCCLGNVMSVVRSARSTDR